MSDVSSKLCTLIYSQRRHNTRPTYGYWLLNTTVLAALAHRTAPYNFSGRYNVRGGIEDGCDIELFSSNIAEPVSYTASQGQIAPTPTTAHAEYTMSRSIQHAWLNLPRCPTPGWPCRRSVSCTPFSALCIITGLLCNCIHTRVLTHRSACVKRNQQSSALLWYSNFQHFIAAPYTTTDRSTAS